MDPTRFDHLTRLLGRAGGRRSVLGALLAGVLAPAMDAVARKSDRDEDRDRNRGGDRDRRSNRTRDDAILHSEARGKKRRTKKKKRVNSGGGQPEPPPECCGTDSCPPPERGSTSAGCNVGGQSFAGQNLNGSIFRGIDGRGANFTATNNEGSVFAEACLQGSRFRRARLGGSTWGGACLFGADFTGADLGGDSAVFNGALFCGTTMPDGSVNDRDCGRATSCCQTQPSPSCQRAADCPDQPCLTKACTNGQCVYAAVADGPTPNGACGANSSGHCCEGECCLGDATECNPSGLCCAPNCEGRECGPDGCGSGGTCGPGCRPGQTCDEAGQCTGVPSCTTQSCPNGCCDDDGNCRPGNTLQRCGTGGASCQSCNDSRVCQDGQCVTCSPNCICQGQDFCADPGAPNATCFEREDGPECVCLVSRAGQPFCSGTQDASGTNCTSDADCQSFAPGSVCVDAAPSGSLCQTGNNFCAAPCCTPQNCAGCCIGGTCLPGTARDACGIDGELCVDCSQGGDVCQNGQCVCTAESCPDGCCDAGPGNPGVCLPGTSAESCGTNGARCATCTGQDVCQDGRCVCAPDCAGRQCGPDGCGGNCGSCPAEETCNEQTGQCIPECNAQNCANGCCAQDGTCQPGNTNETCGTPPGGPCTACGPCQTCAGQGVCIPTTGAICGNSTHGGTTLRCCNGACPDPDCITSSEPQFFSGDCPGPCGANGQNCCNRNNGITCGNGSCTCLASELGGPCGSDNDCQFAGSAIACICGTCQDPPT